VDHDHFESLGNGIRIRRDRGELVVLSEGIDPGWREARGHLPGTAVRWNDEIWEVVESTRGSSVVRWRLRPWRWS